MQTYYELDDGRSTVAMPTFEEAVEYADNRGASYISTIGGDWRDYIKCHHCGEWLDACHLTTADECPHCKHNIRR